MSKSFRKDLTGQRFGRLTVIEFVPTEKTDSYWKCECWCGNMVTVRLSDLTDGKTQSCGCQHREIVTSIGKKGTHYLKNTRLYHIRTGMKDRCYNPNSKAYERYGGRGIKVCDEWKDNFQAFYDWAMSNGYNDSLSIDRIDNNGDYSPENCRFVTAKKQARNRRDNVIVKYQGKDMSLAEAAEKSNISYGTIFERYKRGDRGKRLFRKVNN